MRALILLALCGSLVADAQAVIVDKTLDPTGIYSLQLVANEVWLVVRDLFGSDPPVNLPIECHFERPLPITRLDNQDRPTKILIGINSTERHWAQFAYQLGHELGHVMMNPRRTNSIIETICMALSYEVLERLHKKWGTGTPFVRTVLTDYGEEFEKYKKENDDIALARLPSAIKIAAERRNWIAVRQYLHEQLTDEDLRSDHAHDVQTLGAIALRSGPITWNQLWNLGKCTSPPPEEMRGLATLPIGPDCIRRLPMLCRIVINCSDK